MSFATQSEPGVKPNLPREILLMVVREAILGVCDDLDKARDNPLRSTDDLRGVSYSYFKIISRMARVDRSFNREVIKLLRERRRALSKENTEKREELLADDRARHIIDDRSRVLIIETVETIERSWIAGYTIQKTEKETEQLEKSLLLKDRKAMQKEMGALRDENESLKKKLDMMKWMLEGL